MSSFELHGADLPERRMSTPGIIKHLDVIGDFGACGVASRVGLAVHAFFLERGKETPDGRVSWQSPRRLMLQMMPSAESRLWKSSLVSWVDSNGRCNTSAMEVAMTSGSRRSDLSGRAKLRSPSRPPVGRRAERQNFRTAIAAGRSSEEAAASAQVTPAVGVRWIRETGGMPPSHLALSAPPLSGRYLSLA